MEGLATPFEAIAQGIRTIGEHISNIISYINPFSEKFFGRTIVENIGNLLRDIFVPDTTAISERLESIKSKFGFVEGIAQTINQFREIMENTSVSTGLTINIPKNSANINSLKVIDVSWYEPFKPYGDMVITALIYLFFGWRVYVDLPSIIGGISSGAEIGINLGKNSGKK